MKYIIKYSEINKDYYIYKYSLSNYNSNTNNASYRCLDKHYNERGNIIITYESDNNENFKLTKKTFCGIL